MFSDFFSLALQGILRKKRSSILVFLVLMFSFSCAITTLSLTKSISDTNTEFRLNTYGEWYVAAVRSTVEDGEWLTSQSWAGKTVHNRMLSNVAFDCVGNSGMIDLDFFDMGRSEMIAGRLPEKKNEIAMSEKALESLGIEDYKIGQEIKMATFFKETKDGVLQESTVASAELRGILCGVLGDIDELWTVSYQPGIKLALTEETLDDLYEKSIKWYNANRPDYTPVAPEFYEQYYIEVDREDRLQAYNDIRTHQFTPREDGLPQWVDVNHAAYPIDQQAVADDELYSYLVAAVALVAIICIYILQLPSEVHSFAVLRSIGITKGQLLLLSFMESMLLAIPAILLGIPLGMILTRTALSSLMYSGSVAVQVAIPYGKLVKLFVLWLGIILLSRLVIFFITIRTPLTGRMQMNTSTARKAKGLRTALIALILMIFGSSVVFSTTESARSFYWLDWHEVVPDYTISGSSVFPLTPEKAELIASIPGVRQVEVFAQRTDTNPEKLYISYEGLEQRAAPTFFVLDENYWDECLDFGEDREAFHNGDVVFLCFGGYSSYFDSEPADEILPAPGDKITLRAQSREGIIVAEDTVDVVVRHLPSQMRNRSLGAFTSYSVVMSEAYFRKFVSNLPREAEWCDNLGKGEYGYPGILATADSNADDLSADVALETLCKNNDLFLRSDHEYLLTQRQSFTQDIIMLFACGGCVALVALLLLGGALSLEVESEKRSYSILRAIGMSRRQVKRKELGKALVRSVLAVVCGWVLTVGFNICTAFRTLKEKNLKNAFDSYFGGLKYFHFGWIHVLLISAVCIIVLAAVSILMKRRLWKKQFSVNE